MDKSEVEKVATSSDEASALGRNRSFKSKQLVRSQAIRESQSPPRTSSPASATVDLSKLNITDKPNVNNTVTNVTTNSNSTGVTNKYTNNVQYNVARNDTNKYQSNAAYSNTKAEEEKVTVVIDNDSKRNNVDVRLLKTQSDISSHASDDVCSVTSFSEKSESDELKKKQPVEIQITPGLWESECPAAARVRSQRGRWGRGRSSSPRDLLSNHPRLNCVCGRCRNCPHCRGRRRKPACPTKQDSGIVCSDDCPDCSDTDNGSNADGKKTQSVDDEQTFYCRCPERKEKPKSMSLSRTDSDDKSEPTSEDIVNFIKDTLNKSPRDRLTLLRIERELHALVTDTGRCVVRFPVMTSYGRLLVHRCAALFHLTHHLDQGTRSAVLVTKTGTSGGRIPCTPFIEWCTSPLPKLPARHQDTAKSILKRDTQSLDEPGSGAMNTARSKSLEQRERDYERVRRRIFSSENSTQDESQWPWLNSGPVKLLTSESGRNKLLKVQSLESGCTGHSGRCQAALPKSHSFDHVGGRVLSRRGDLASSSWRLSPSSSGYRTLSLHSADSITPSPTGGASPEPCPRGIEGEETIIEAVEGTVAGREDVPVARGEEKLEGKTMVWCVTDMAAVPAGAVVLHPQTGRPLLNPDGTVYHFDPANPPVLCESAPPEHKVEQNYEKRRGRLEKQNSFIDNESECQVSEECRSKCCCECRHHDSEKTTSPIEQKSSKPPSSPSKNRYEQTPELPANQSTPTEVSANHRTPYEATNQKPATETNQRQENQTYSPSPNQRPALARHYESTNQRQEPRFEHQRQASYEAKHYEATNQRAGNELGSHVVHRSTNQENHEMQYYGQQYSQYRHDDMVSPQVVSGYGQQEMMLHAMTPSKIMPIADPNMRPMSLTNVMYPAPLPQPYQFVNQCRIEQPLQTVYQPVLAPDDKQLAPSPHTENTFRIDPSYPYVPTDITGTSCCAPCVDTTALQHRGANVAPYPVDSSAFQPTAVIPPAPQLHYPYAEPQVPWPGVQTAVGVPGKVYVQEVFPLVHYPPLYPHYNHLVYPQMMPQYPMTNMAATAATPPRLPKRNSLPGSSRTTPLQTPPDDKKVPYDHHAREHAASTSGNVNVGANASASANTHVANSNNEIAAKIQQIKEQLNARQRNNSGSMAPNNQGWWRRRNSGSGPGLLGAPPQAPHHTTHRHPQHNRRSNDESQLSSAARAIVNSIRSMQAKNHYQERRPEYNQSFSRDKDANNFARRSEQDRRDVTARPPYLIRQMSPGTWCRRSPGPVHPGILNNPRRPHPDARNPRR